MAYFAFLVEASTDAMLKVFREDDFGELNELIREEWLVGKCKFGGVFAVKKQQATNI